MRWRIAQQGGKQLNGVIERRLGELTQSFAALDDRRRQGFDRLPVAVGRPQHRIADERHMPDHAGQDEVGEEAGLDQRRLARAARSEHQYKGLSAVDTPG